MFEMLYCLGPYMHSDPILLAKIVRLGRVFMKDKSSRNAEEPEKVGICIQRTLTCTDSMRPGLVRMCEMFV